MQHTIESTTATTAHTPTAALVAAPNRVHMEELHASGSEEDQHMNIEIGDEMAKAEYISSLLSTSAGTTGSTSQRTSASDLKEMVQYLGQEQQLEKRNVHKHFQHQLNNKHTHPSVNTQVTQDAHLLHDVMLTNPDSIQQLQSPHQQPHHYQHQNHHQQSSPHQQQNIHQQSSPHQQQNIHQQSSPHQQQNIHQQGSPHQQNSPHQQHSPHQQNSPHQQHSPHQQPIHHFHPQQHVDTQHQVRQNSMIGQQNVSGMQSQHDHHHQEHQRQQVHDHHSQEHQRQQAEAQLHFSQVLQQHSNSQQQHIRQNSGHNMNMNSDQRVEAMPPSQPEVQQQNSQHQHLVNQSKHHHLFGTHDQDQEINQQMFQQTLGGGVEQSIDSPSYLSTNIPASSDYRNNPSDFADETSAMAFGDFGSDPLQTDLSVFGDETTFVSSPSRPVVSTDFDPATISAILEPSQRIHITDDQIAEHVGIHSTAAARDYDESPRKMSRVGSLSDDSSVMYDKLFSFETNSTQPSTSGYQFTKFGMEISTAGPMHTSSTSEPSTTGNLQFSSNGSQSNRISDTKPIISPVTSVAHTPLVSPHAPNKELQCSDSNSSYSVALPAPVRSPRRKYVYKSPPLNHSYADRHGSIVLKILKQPETQHRARYMTEGSRGAVKDTHQQGHPIVQLLGWNEDARLEVFIGADSGKVKPHGFYQACRISGKNASASRERQVDGTNVIEMEFEQSKQMTATIDCVGILKLRNTDVEKRIGLVKNKKKSTKCRLIYRVNLCLPSGAHITLQTASTVIACTQPAGQPEISRMSIDRAPFAGGQSLFVIGKNFVKGFLVRFQQITDESEKPVWEQVAEIEHEFTHTTHFICTVPSYKPTTGGISTVSVQVVVEASGGTSEPLPFSYELDDGPKEMSTSHSCTSMSSSPQATASPMTTGTPVSSHDSPPISIVAPEALELVAQLQQQSSTSTSKMFQIPNGVDFISQDSSGGASTGGASSGYKGATEIYGDFKPISLTNGLVNPTKFSQGSFQFQSENSSNPIQHQ